MPLCDLVSYMQQHLSGTAALVLATDSRRTLNAFALHARRPPKGSHFPLTAGPFRRGKPRRRAKVVAERVSPVAPPRGHMKSGN